MSEERERLEAMIANGQQTWDLSEKDEAAIRWALSAIDSAITLAVKYGGIIGDHRLCLIIPSCPRFG